jgi:hypothetical protein
VLSCKYFILTYTNNIYNLSQGTAPFIIQEFGVLFTYNGGMCVVFLNCKVFPAKFDMTGSGE